MAGTARRTLCTLSVRSRAPTKQMGPYLRSNPLLLHGAEGQPGDYVALREERDEQDGQRDEGRRGGKGAPLLVYP